MGFCYQHGYFPDTTAGHTRCPGCWTTIAESVFGCYLMKCADCENGFEHDELCRCCGAHYFRERGHRCAGKEKSDKQG